MFSVKLVEKKILNINFFDITFLEFRNKSIFSKSHIGGDATTRESYERYGNQELIKN
jgi:hypothetical protein